MTRKPAFAHSANFDEAIWRNLLSMQMKQSHWLLCVAKNCLELQQKQNWIAKSTNLEKMLEK